MSSICSKKSRRMFSALQAGSEAYKAGCAYDQVPPPWPKKLRDAWRRGWRVARQTTITGYGFYAGTGWDPDENYQCCPCARPDLRKLWIEGYLEGACFEHIHHGDLH